MTRLAVKWCRANGAFLLWLADQIEKDRLPTIVVRNNVFTKDR